jgi:hypothetical protein
MASVGRASVGYWPRPCGTFPPENALLPKNVL